MMDQRRNTIADETKRFLSVPENFGSKAFVLVRFQIFFETIKCFFVFEKPWRNLQRFGFVLISFLKNKNVLF